MSDEIIIASLNKDFESIKKINKNGIEYWEARELMPLMGYKNWRDFDNSIQRAKIACKNSGQAVEDHFEGAPKMIKIAKNTTKEAERKIEDYNLSRYACYLIAQNGDSRKQEIAMAQTYFAMQTRKQEIFQQMEEAEKRLYVRGEVKNHNKKLFTTAQKAGVSNFGKFNNAGYFGLYNMHKQAVQKKKGLGGDDILDRAGTTELAANLFRITQTNAKIINDKIAGEKKANFTHFTVGRKVRKAIEDIGGVMPENLPPERHIKELKSEKKKLLKNVKRQK